MNLEPSADARAVTPETIVLAGGCFWCTEAVFSAVRGVMAVESGYANGHVSHPSYAQVCRGDTGHAEAVRLTFDAARLTLHDVLTVFFGTHDPTTPNRQGADRGPQYRSAIFTTSSQQQREAEAFANALRAEGVGVVTQIEPLRTFWPAEAEHQRYAELNPEQGYCRMVIEPKLAHLRQGFAHLLAG